VTQQEWIVAAAVATPFLAFLGALAGHWVRRRSDTELDRCGTGGDGDSTRGHGGAPRPLMNDF
jgi:hypothetical protein